MEKFHVWNSIHGQVRLNNTAILHIHHNFVDVIDLKLLMNDLISQNTKQSAVFEDCKQNMLLP